jgi:hypothetical protein
VAGESNPPVGKKKLSLEGPHFGVSVELEYSVSRKTILHLRCSESGVGFRAAVASKESEDPNELRGVKTLLSGLLVEISVLAKALSRRK